MALGSHPIIHSTTANPSPLPSDHSSPSPLLPELVWNHYALTPLRAQLVVSHWDAAFVDEPQGHVDNNPGASGPLQISLQAVESQGEIYVPRDVHFLKLNTSYQGKSKSDFQTSASVGSSISGTSITALGISQSQWHCRVCLKDPTNPTATLCGHIFCHTYVHRHSPLLIVLKHLQVHCRCPA